MKNIIKRMVILGIVIFVLTARPMIKEIHIFQKRKLKNVNPLKNMGGLGIFMQGCSEIWGQSFCRGKLCDDKGLPLSLASVKFIEEPDPVKNKEVLQTIEGAIGQGVALESRYHPSKPKNGTNNRRFVYILYSENSVSLFTIIKNWLGDGHVDKHKKDNLMRAIVRGGNERQKQLADMRDKFRAAICRGLKIDISEDLMLLILSWDEKYAASEKAKKLIKQGEESWNGKRK